MRQKPSQRGKITEILMRTWNLLKISGAFVAAVLLIAAQTQAEVAYNFPSTLAGNQVGGPYSLGTVFNVSTPIAIEQLGAFDDGTNGIAGVGINVAIYKLARRGNNITGGTLVTPSVYFFGTAQPLLTGTSTRVASISTVILGAGTYMVVANHYGVGESEANDNHYGFGESEVNYNPYLPHETPGGTNGASANPALGVTFGGGYFHPDSGLAWGPTLPTGWHYDDVFTGSPAAPRYAAGNFVFTPGPVRMTVDNFVARWYTNAQFHLFHAPSFEEIEAKEQTLGLDRLYLQKLEALSAEQLKQEQEPAVALRGAIPPRDLQAGTRLIDLSSNYNAAFAPNWHGDSEENDLAELPRRLRQFDGVEFDVRGIVQAPPAGFGAPPGTLTNIVVQQPCSRLHFLHAAIFAGGLTNPIEVGRYIVHFEEGPDVEIPLRAGIELADWWQLPGDVAPRVPVAWTGQNGKARRSPDCSIRLFHLVWDNPKPGLVVRSIDLATTHAQARPFLVGLTLE